MNTIKRAIAAVQRFFSKADEPLRRRVYTILAMGIALGVSTGVVTGSEATTVTTLVAAVLMVPTTEAARSVVMPHRGKHEAPEPK